MIYVIYAMQLNKKFLNAIDAHLYLVHDVLITIILMIIIVVQYVEINNNYYFNDNNCRPVCRNQ